MRQIMMIATLAVLTAGLLLPASADDGTEVASVHQTNDGLIHAGDEVFTSWADYVRSDFFEENGKRYRVRVEIEEED